MISTLHQPDTILLPIVIIRGRVRWWNPISRGSASHDAVEAASYFERLDRNITLVTKDMWKWKEPTRRANGAPLAPIRYLDST